VVLPDLDLDWAADGARHVPGTGVDDDEPAGARLGPDAVARAAVVVVPALAVSRDGTRLGQGGGSYDRALARVPAGALVVALLHDGELVDAGELPAERHDRPVDVVVTPTAVVRTTAATARG
ncbi:5-formyltetrahydrofolate cyclo-ligase, partial [Angustibacter peucedani]